MSSVKILLSVHFSPQGHLSDNLVVNALKAISSDVLAVLVYMAVSVSDK